MVGQRNPRLAIIAKALVNAVDYITAQHQFGVSQRTIFRDVHNLREMGVPVVGEPGGGYRLGPSTPIHTTLALDDLMVLVAAALASTYDSVRVDRAVGRLMGQLPAPLASALRDRIDDGVL